MKKLTCGFLTKLLAFLLCILCLLTAVAGTAGLIAMGESGILHTPEGILRQDVLTQQMDSLIDDLLTYTLYYEDGAADLFPVHSGNLRYRVSFNGYPIDSNTEQFPDSGTQLHRTFILTDAFDTNISTHQSPGLQKLYEQSGDSVIYLTEVEVSVDMYLVSGLPYPDAFRTAAAAVHLLCMVRPVLGWIIAGSLLLGILLLVYLFRAAGRRPGQEGVTPNPLDLIPADLYLALCTVVCLLLFSLFIRCMDEFLYAGAYAFGWLIPAGLCLLASCCVVLGFFLSAATRIKLRTFLKNTLVWYILSFLGRSLRKLGQGICHAVRSLPSIWPTVVVLAAVLLADFFITANLISLRYEEDLEFAYWLLRTAVLTGAVIVAALNLRAIRQGCRDLAAGRLDARVDTRRLIGGFRSAGEDVNSIGKGMAKAVDERMKSERMKTELITNVSHDIKTPLTSIINYVDLIKKEEPESPALREYVDVLDRQSTRLKKLIEDLMEASKASTGALSSSPEPCELGVLLQQSAGEFTEKLAAAGLTPVVDHPETPVYIMADGRHLARVFDNLLNNACKYGQPGTRLYLTLKEAGGKAVVTLRNISREALNIDGDELTERFVRGDRSRHTEGSGLGLSIARSLVELQGGSMKLTVDGDLFKVALVFPAVPAPQPEAEASPAQAAFDAAAEKLSIEKETPVPADVVF